jgi:hypothetical protein
MAGGRRLARAATIFSVVFGLWALGVALTPFFPGALVASASGAAFGWIALRKENVARWRRAAVLGLLLNAVAIAIVFVIFVALAM